MNIACTQTELKPVDQKKLVESWCEVLPSPGQHTMVLPTGKGKPWMCQTCDAKKIEKHVTQFNKIVSEFSAAHQKLDKSHP